VLSVILFATAGYFIQQQIIRFLLAPSKGQQFIYTTPGGGLNFLFQICLYFGIALSIPVIIYQLLKYLEPLIETSTKRMVVGYSFFSGILAITGGAFGYYLGLPVALKFLSHQFTTSQIKPLLTIQEYMSFLTIYLVGSALLFQIPLIITFINRIKPLRPKKLLSAEKYVIAFSFIAAAIMTPTTDIFNQLIFAVPIVAMYQVAVLFVYLQNKRKKLDQPVLVSALQQSIPEPVPVALAYSASSFGAGTAPAVSSRSAGMVWDIVKPYRNTPGNLAKNST
jgi:sec-independent protein translocase protein TatC